MEPIFIESLGLMHIGLILVLTCAQLLIVYFLSESSNPPSGLGLFSVYFMAALMGWILFALHADGGQRQMPMDIQAIVGLIGGYLLFLAASQRAGLRRGRYALAIAGLAAAYGVLFLPPTDAFQIQLAGIALLWAGAGWASACRAWNRRNVGDGLLALGGVVSAAGCALAWWQWQDSGQLAHSQALALGLHGTAQALVVVGFLASVLLEYQQHLSHLATVDPLTRLLNKRGLEDAIFVSLAAAARQKSKTSAILLDIDHFRQVNDSFGRDLGDRAIQRVAELLAGTCRASDALARISGEEFLVVMPDTDEQAARALAERIRSGIAEQALPFDGHSIPLTASLGVATITGATDLDSLVSEAGRAIYLAKRAGCNRVAAVDKRPRHFHNHGQVTGPAR